MDMVKSRKKSISIHGPVQAKLPISNKKRGYYKPTYNNIVFNNFRETVKLNVQKDTDTQKLEISLSRKNSRSKIKKKQKVAILTWDCLPEGEDKIKSTHTIRLAATLAKDGHKIHVFTRGEKEEVSNQKIDGVHYHRIHIDSNIPLLKGASIFADRIYKHIKRMESRENPFNVIHCYDWHPAKAIKSLQNGISRHIIVAPHMNGKEPSSDDKQIIQQNLLTQELIKESDRIVCFEQGIGIDIQQRLSLPEEKVFIISKEFDWQDYQWIKDPGEVKKKYDVWPLDPLILFVGELNNDYGPDILADAVPALLKNNPQVRFLFVGCGELEWPIRIRAHYLLFEHAIRLVGHKAGRDLQELFQAADIVVIPNRIKTFPYQVLAAWSAKKPVVATNEGSFGLINHLENGILVYDHPNSIVWGIERILFDCDKGHEIAQKGWEGLLEKYTWNAISKKLKYIYQSEKRK
jgi:glycosyltransferase involved in cell wall biosynthesis